MRTATQLGPDNPFNQASLIYILGRAGCTGEAEQLLDELSAACAYVPRLSLNHLGRADDNERALQALEEAFGDREPCLVSLKVEPIFDPLRDDDRSLI